VLITAERQMLNCGEAAEQQASLPPTFHDSKLSCGKFFMPYEFAGPLM
jgi:hypothetical protein